MRFYVVLGAREIIADVALSPDGRWQVRIDDSVIEVDAVPLAVHAGGHASGRRTSHHSVRIDGRIIDLMVDTSSRGWEFSALGMRGHARVESEWMRSSAGADERRRQDGASLVVSPMPGRVVRVLVAPGDDVQRGAALVVVEAMKMENELHAAGAGRVVEVLVKPGDNVETGAKLVVLA
jgi:biotin carboxyl carrier protein